MEDDAKYLAEGEKMSRIYEEGYWEIYMLLYAVACTTFIIHG